MDSSAQKLVSSIGELPPMPDVAAKVMQMISNPDVSAKALQEVIMKDPGMTVNILKLANSALFGLKREVKTLTHAIMLMGFSTIRSVVLAFATKKIYSKAQGFKQQLLWKNAITAASVARFLAEEIENHSKEEAFIGGLLHNVGRVVMLSKFGEDYGELMQKAYNEGLELNALEKETYGFSHSEVNYHILAKWNLPDNLVKASRYYWEPEHAPASATRLAAIVGLSVLFGASKGVGIYRESDEAFETPDSFMQLLGRSPEQMAQIIQTLEEKMNSDLDTLTSL